jgi:hypothetical protein
MAEGEKLMQALALPKAPTPETAALAAAQIVKSAGALRAVADRHSVRESTATSLPWETLMGAETYYKYGILLNTWAETPALEKLMRACLANGKVSASDLTDLSKAPGNQKLGYLFSTAFQVKSYSKDGSMKLGMTRRWLDLSSTEPHVSDWNPELSIRAASNSSYTFQLTGRWLGDQVVIELQPSVSE